MNRIKQNNKMSIALLVAVVAVIAAAVIMLPQAFNSAHAESTDASDTQKAQPVDSSNDKKKDIIDQSQEKTIAPLNNNLTNIKESTSNSVPGMLFHSKNGTTGFSILNKTSMGSEAWTNVPDSPDASFFQDPLPDSASVKYSYQIKEQSNTKSIIMQAETRGAIVTYEATFYTLGDHTNPLPSNKITITENENYIDIALEVGEPATTDASVSVSAGEGGYIQGEPLEFDASKTTYFFCFSDMLIIGDKTYIARGTDNNVFDKWTSDGVTPIPTEGTISQNSKFVATFKEGVKYTISVDDSNTGCYLYNINYDNTKYIVNEYSVVLSTEMDWTIDYRSDYGCWVISVEDPNLGTVSINAYRSDDPNIANWKVEQKDHVIHISGVAPIQKINIHSKDNTTKFYSELWDNWDNKRSENYDLVIEDCDKTGLNGCKIEEHEVEGETYTTLFNHIGTALASFYYLDDSGNVGERIPADKIKIDTENNEIVVDTSKDEPIDASVWIEADNGGRIESSSPLEIHIDKQHTGSLNNDTHELTITDQTTNTEYKYTPVTDDPDSEFKYWVADSVPYKEGKIAINGDTHFVAHFDKKSSPQPGPDPEPKPGEDSHTTDANASAQTGDVAPFVIGAIVAVAIVAILTIVSPRKKIQHRH